MDIIFSILYLGVVGFYLYLGVQANDWIKYHLLGVRYEMYSDTSDFWIGKLLWALIFGMITIPLVFVLRMLGVGRR